MDRFRFSGGNQAILRILPQRLQQPIPLGTLASIPDIVAAALYLASPAAAMVTGAHLLVDGGWTAQ